MKIKVLHVEDNPGDARLMREILSEAPTPHFELTHVERMSDAVDRLGIEHFDVILLDLSLPDVQGLQTVYRMCGAAPEVPIVVLTGLDDESLAVKAVQVGAQDYLLKSRLDGHLSVRAIRYAIERQRSRTELRSQTLMDELTGLYNRRGFMVIAEQQLRVAYRELGDLVLVFADLDGLKQINDTFGHQEGDRALMTTAKILRETLRESDLVARLGGDEFTILAVDHSGTSAETIMARLRESLDAYNARTESPYRLALSVGVARLDPRCSFSIKDLLAEADDALYEQKRRKQRSKLDVVTVTKTDHARTS